MIYQYDKEDGLSLCPHCGCMTKTQLEEPGSRFVCGKCGKVKFKDYLIGEKKKKQRKP